jgi:uncharacterized protein (DUF169 family)
MKLFERKADMEAVPKIRRPNGSLHTLDQIVAQAARLGWTVGVTTEDLIGDQCRSVVGLGGQDEKWRSGAHMKGVWFATLEDAGKHQAAMNLVPRGKYEALAVAPLASGRLDPPDIALFYATPGAMIYFINGCNGRATSASTGAASANPRARIHGDARSRRAARACRSRALPSAATAACSTTRC